MNNDLEQFKSRVIRLEERIKSWAEPHEWITKTYPKKFRDDNLQPHEIPALYLQKGATRLLLDPVANDVPGSEGLVDLYLMPTYDDMASLYFQNNDWVIHYAFPADPWETHSVIEAKEIPLSEESVLKVLEAISNNAEPSF